MLAATVVAGAFVALVRAPEQPTAAYSAASPGIRVVPCGASIATTAFPYLGSHRSAGRYREVLGVVSAPPAYMPQVLPTNHRPWAFWHKQGIVLRATRQTVTVTVPDAWRRRVAVSWGGIGAPTGALRLRGCGSSPDRGIAFAGGFFLRSRAACVPLVFRVGTRSATVRFGLGRRCRHDGRSS